MFVAVAYRRAIGRASAGRPRARGIGAGASGRVDADAGHLADSRRRARRRAQFDAARPRDGHSARGVR